MKPRDDEKINISFSITLDHGSNPDFLFLFDPIENGDLETATLSRATEGTITNLAENFTYGFSTYAEYNVTVIASNAVSFSLFFFCFTAITTFQLN